MPGPAPAANRRRRNAPARGDWSQDEALGWQHGEVPAPPKGLNAAAKDTWSTWMGSWFAAHWEPADLPALTIVIKLYARAWSGRATSSERSELRQLMDSYGITPKGQQDRRWAPPAAAERDDAAAGPAEAAGPYGHLRVVGEA